jgi:hypothetical protein
VSYITEGKDGKLKVYFDSVPDVFETIAREGWVPARDKQSDSRRSGSFHVFDSLSEAHDVFFNRPESIRQFSINDEKLVSRDSPGKDVQYEVTGDYVDIDRYLEGVPENFGQAVMGNPKTVFATINVLLDAVYWTTPAYMMHKQKRIMRLVDWLETQDIRCQIVLTSSAGCLFAQIIVKQFHDPFDLNQLAVAMHPDFFRRTIFLLIEQSKTFRSGYGNGEEYDARMFNYKPNPDDGLYIYVGGYVPYGDGTTSLDADFDRIEDTIQDMVDAELFWSDEQLVAGGKGGKKGW